MFKQKNDWFDACCEVDVGKMRMTQNKNYYNYREEKYFEMDNQFFQTLVQRMKLNHDLSDDEIRRAFESYTLLALDLAMQLDD